MNNAYLIEGLEAGPRTLEILLNRVDPAAMDRPTHPDRFSPREVIAHMADWEPRLLDRIQAAKLSPESKVLVWDEGDLAIENDYAGSDWRERLGAFQQARRDTIQFLKSLEPADWDRHFIHPERGRMTIEDQAAFFLGHDLYHCDQLSEVAS